jgi:MFS transporter, DHA1 family, multidrug resistance protein
MSTMKAIPAGPARAAGAAVSTSLVLTLALQSAVPPFATDMYTPAFPRVRIELATSASLVGLTLTTFFLGMALGQLLGGPLSDQRGRRRPMIVGGLICTLGAVGCALAPSIGLLIVFRVVQGFGGGLAAVVARAVVVDVAKGDMLAKVMSIMMALGGLAPMVAPSSAARYSPSAGPGGLCSGSWSASGC